MTVVVLKTETEEPQSVIDRFKFVFQNAIVEVY
jgi:hypothetical protein